MNHRSPWLVALAILALACALLRGLTLAAGIGGGIAAPTLWLAVGLQVVGAVLAALAWFFRPGLASAGLVLLGVGVLCQVLLEAFVHGTRAPLSALAFAVVAVVSLAALAWVSRAKLRDQR